MHDRNDVRQVKTELHLNADAVIARCISLEPKLCGFLHESGLYVSSHEKEHKMKETFWGPQFNSLNCKMYRSLLNLYVSLGLMQ